ncbi:hypothetical protein LAT59_00140 [Candidatus Gracilibacteria bacterium]|nr:hypothetical protein [Candidatus Gracilibacteria bacterium]
MNKEGLQEYMRELGERTGLIDFYLQEIASLSKDEDIVIRIVDFDDTLFSREEQLEKESALRENRGGAGIDVIVNSMGISQFIDTYYRGHDFPHDIFNLMNPETDVILTAGLRELQYMKTEAVGLLDFPTTVVDEGKDKVLEVLRYIVFEFGVIPREVIIYEDRPEYFIQYRELLESLLGIKITIMKVEMDGNRGYKRIEEV